MNIDMKQYGLTDRVLALASMYPELTVGRIVSQEKGLYRIVTSNGEKLAAVSGKFRYGAVTVSDYPAVGDFVMADWNEAGGNAIIQNVLHRKSCFTRKAAGDARQEQIVAANIDTVFLCMSLNNDFNLRRLERYLSVAWDSGSGIDQTFGEIEELASYCRFKGCTHHNEPGCAVQRALQDGTLSEKRWLSYQKVKAENEYATDSQSYLAGKEKKFKEIAKFKKSNRKR